MENREVTLHPYAAFLHKLAKPARYTGGEAGSRRREWTADVAKVCLAFPDVYDIGMSHLGFKILYGILNDDPRTLAERCYAPWVDLEAELRARKLPLVSLESKRPLSDFDVVGFSLQFELTYTNILNMLELGGVPLRAADRGEGDPLVIAGGPVATHPEPIAPFLDAIVIGDGEEKATQVALTWKSLKDAGVPRLERLRALARLGAVYVPGLYTTSVDPDTGWHAVDAPRDPALPFPIERSLVDLAKYPFPDESPAGGPEAIFDRMSIEIARGCTEGCRFCQAGMIYRPVRERDPEEIVRTVVSAIEKSGQDEVSLTALSTADVSCISPLIKKVSDELTKRRVSLGVSSLRAYGLEPELLDQLKRVRATGLTFAPEAGTQRMRDVINKNVTEDQLLETAERVFSRGWGKMKLYFICGLPTETDEDVLGIVETGKRAREVGKRAAARGKPVDVVVSVSVHVPKPHTPFQWCAMDSLETIARKQRLLREASRGLRGLSLRMHDADASVIEGMFARGDRRLADALELAFRKGARFDSWDDQLRLEVWAEAFGETGVVPETYLGTIPVTARLPWSHIDVGLEDGFLAREYRKALASRLSPPCGKVAGAFVHPTNVADAQAEQKRLVCYDCGVACDMTKMRSDRVTFLERLGALAPPGPPPPPVRRLPVIDDGPPKKGPSTQRVGERWRFTYEKTGPTALISHLDLIRELTRVFRRAGLDMEYTRGFHPKPDMTFGPALALGVPSLGEAIDVRLLAAPAQSDEELLAEMTACSPEGLRFVAMEPLHSKAPSISRRVVAARYALILSEDELSAALARRDVTRTPREELAVRVAALWASERAVVRRTVGDLSKNVDVRGFLERIELAHGEEQAEALRAFPAPRSLVVVAEARITDGGAAKPTEIADVLLGELADDVSVQPVRLALVLGDPALAAELPAVAPVAEEQVAAL